LFPIRRKSLYQLYYFSEDETKYGKKSPYVPFPDFFNYRYQINIDGTVAAYRLPYLLLGNSLVLKQDSKYYEHFYSVLKPYEDFLPIKSDLSDLIDQIKWAQENENKILQMIKSANLKVSKALEPRELLCYWTTVLEVFDKDV